MHLQGIEDKVQGMEDKVIIINPSIWYFHPQICGTFLQRRSKDRAVHVLGSERHPRTFASSHFMTVDFHSALNNSDLKRPRCAVLGITVHKRAPFLVERWDVLRTPFSFLVQAVNFTIY